MSFARPHFVTMRGQTLKASAVGFHSANCVDPRLRKNNENRHQQNAWLSNDLYVGRGFLVP
jgi:hypothetical protein